jgi:hypothetical protein
MAAAHLHNMLLLLVALATLQLLIEPATAHPIKCKYGCSLNRKGIWVCRHKGRIIVCKTKHGVAPCEEPLLNPLNSPEHPSSSDSSDLENCIAAHAEFAGYVYDYDDQRYEYEDGTVVPGFDTPAAPASPDEPHIQSAPYTGQIKDVRPMSSSHPGISPSPS